MDIVENSVVIKRGICPKTDPCKVQVRGFKYIRLVPRRLARKVNVR